MNAKRIVMGGLLAGLVLNILEALAGIVLGMEQEWTNALKALGKSVPNSPPANALFLSFGFLLGLVAVWFYAAIRPRFGPGPKTALIAAMGVFLPGPFLAGMVEGLMGWVPVPLAVNVTVLSFFELIAATLLGAWVYKENDVSTASSDAKSAAARG